MASIAGEQFANVFVPRLNGSFLSSWANILGNQWAYQVANDIVSDNQEMIKLVDIGTVGSIEQFSNRRKVTTPTSYIMYQQNVPYVGTLEVDAEDVRRDSVLGQFEAKAAELAYKYGDQWNKLGSALLLANPKGFDNQPFFGSTHTIASNVNDLTYAQNSYLAVADDEAPTGKEMMMALMSTCAYFSTMLDEAGDPISMDASDFMIVSSNPLLIAAANQAIGSQQLDGGQTDILDVIQTSGKAGLNMKNWKFRTAIDPRLGSATNTIFYVFRVDSPIKAFARCEETGLELGFLGEGSQLYSDHNRFRWSAKAVRSLGVQRYQNALGCTLSNS
jgi:Mu-like prophage major head subunit gpT